MEEILIYLRKSRQDDPGETIEQVLARHEKQLQEYAVKTYGYRIKEENIYREVVSGETIDDRPKINELFKRMEDENVTGVLVIEPQRLTRGDMLDCGTVVHIFRYTNTLVITPSKTYNLADKYDRKFFEMELTRGNDYLEYVKEILARGRSASVHEGNYIASIAPFGYDKVKEGKSYTLAINEKESEYVRMIFDLYIQGNGASRIAKTINDLGARTKTGKLFKESAIRDILKNEIYIGKIRWGHKLVVKAYENGKIVKKRPRNEDYEIIQGKHAPIISEETFEKAKIRKGKTTREGYSTELTNQFAGLIKCKKCGKAIAMRPQNKHCGKPLPNRYYCKSGIYCTTKSCNEDVVVNMVISSLKAALNDFRTKIDNYTVEHGTGSETLINALKSDLKKLEIKQNELYDFLESGIYTKDVFIMRNEKLGQERERLQKALEKAKVEIPTLQEMKTKYTNLHAAIDMIQDDSINAKTKNNFLKEVIDVIYYTKDTATPNHGDDSNNIKLEIILK